MRLKQILFEVIFPVIVNITLMDLTLAQDTMPPMESMNHAVQMPESATHEDPPFPDDCSKMEVWNSVTSSCQPFPLGMEMTHLMLHGNIFGVGILQSGPRGRDDFASTQMLMGDLGTTLGTKHFVNLNLMVTAEKWTLPKEGYPLLLQTGDSNQNGVPYIDAQHPHNSPIMGLTISDTIRLGSNENKNHLKLFFSPVGQSTDGPVAFMHRSTSSLNPDAPLGHHIGQDVGHITSTVTGTSIRLDSSQFEASAFNGEEPIPDKVRMKLGKPNSGAFRFIRYFSKHFFGMASVAYVTDPHPHDSSENITSDHKAFDKDVTHLMRYSASIYFKNPFFERWKMYNTFIYGSVRTFGLDTFRHSIAHEFLLTKNKSNIFGRTEILERLPAELSIVNLSPLENYWITAITIGYSHTLANLSGISLNLGGSITKCIVPNDFSSAYGKNPFGGKIFVELSAMNMWMW